MYIYVYTTYYNVILYKCGCRYITVVGPRGTNRKTQNANEMSAARVQSVYTCEHMYVYIYIYIYIYICFYIPVNHVGEPRRCGQFSKFHVCFWGLDPGNLKFETVRTHRQHICFSDLRRSI